MKQRTIYLLISLLVIASDLYAADKPCSYSTSFLMKSDRFVLPNYAGLSLDSAFKNEVVSSVIQVAQQGDNTRVPFSGMRVVLSACVTVGKGCVYVMFALAPFIAQYLPHILSGTVFATAFGVYTAKQVRENGKKIDEVKEQVDGLTETVHNGFVQAAQERATLAKAEQVAQITAELETLQEALEQGLGQTNQSIKDYTDIHIQRFNQLEETLKMLQEQSIDVACLQDKLSILESSFKNQLQKALQEANKNLKEFLQQKFHRFEQISGQRLSDIEHQQQTLLANQTTILSLLSHGGRPSSVKSVDDVSQMSLDHIVEQRRSPSPVQSFNYVPLPGLKPQEKVHSLALTDQVVTS